ncbi:unnamed protein product [Parnassius apollo]|uniref:(apollo) hypothetical protein n=1 Tax=Parnassius apollo TaxID=110799 RepID=A0A8S3X8V6_PARAO|nr:unnamed protein product [Parnassius apollo]
MEVIKTIILFICLKFVSGYFTLPGKCPENVKLQEEFNLAEFDGTWYQAYRYSSDSQLTNNCSTIELSYKPGGIYVNFSRVDHGLFHRHSIGKLQIIMKKNEVASELDVTFQFENAPRRLKVRRYPFRVLATNYNYYATVYTCQYSPLINKHYIYVWILSRHHLLNDVSKELAMKPLAQIGVVPEMLVKDDWSNCLPKYYDDQGTDPMTFRYAVPILLK